jgi:Spy/CpxP family protein refolding chaperone
MARTLLSSWSDVNCNDQRKGGTAMKKTVVAVALVGVLVLAASAALAWGPGWGRGYGYGYGPGVAAPNLSADQVAKIQKIQSDRYTEVAKVRNELFTKQTELRALFREPALDQAKIAAKQKEIAALQAQLQEKGLATRTAVAEVLTPEQRAQLPTYGPGMGPGFGRGMGMGYSPRMGLGPRW